MLCLTVRGTDGGGSLFQQQCVGIAGRLDPHAKASLFGEFAQRDFEVGHGAVGVGLTEDLGAGNGRAQQQPFGDRLPGISQRIAGGPAQAGEDRMVDAVVMPPAPDGVVPLVPLDEVEHPLHAERLVGERFDRIGLGHDEICVGEQGAVGPENEIVGAGFPVQPRSQFHPEVLDNRGLGLVDQGLCQRPFGDLEIGFDLQGRQSQGLGVVGEAFFGDSIGRERVGQVFFEPQQFLQGVAVLWHRQAADRAVAGGDPRLGGHNLTRQPVVQNAGFVFGRLGLVGRGHGPLVQHFANRLVKADLGVFGSRRQVIEPHSGLAHIHVVALHAMRLQQRLDGLGEGLFLGSRSRSWLGQNQAQEPSQEQTDAHSLQGGGRHREEGREEAGSEGVAVSLSAGVRGEPVSVQSDLGGSTFRRGLRPRLRARLGKKAFRGTHPTRRKGCLEGCAADLFRDLLVTQATSAETRRHSGGSVSTGF